MTHFALRRSMAAALGLACAFAASLPPRRASI